MCGGGHSMPRERDRERERRTESDARSMADLLPAKDNDRHLQSAAPGHCSA